MLDKGRVVMIPLEVDWEIPTLNTEELGLVK
jgi:hypothetical protein